MAALGKLSPIPPQPPQPSTGLHTLGLHKGIQGKQAARRTLDRTACMQQLAQVRARSTPDQMPTCVPTPMQRRVGCRTLNMRQNLCTTSTRARQCPAASCGQQQAYLVRPNVRAFSSAVWKRPWPNLLLVSMNLSWIFSSAVRLVSLNSGWRSVSGRLRVPATEPFTMM